MWQVVVGHVLVQRFEIIEHQNVGARGRALLEDALHVLQVGRHETPMDVDLRRELPRADPVDTMASCRGTS